MDGRLKYPERYFVIDAYNGGVVGDLFYNAPYFNGGDFWPGNPHTLEQSSELLKKERLLPQVKICLGSEIGDPNVQELFGSAGSENRVPMGKTSLILSPHSDLFVWHQFERVDHFSHSHYALRKSSIRRRDRPWTGGNYPPQTVMNTGIRFKKKSILISGQWDKIWFWSRSPLSGVTYPWKGHGLHGSVQYGDLLTFRGETQFLTSILKEVPHGSWNRDVIMMETKGNYQDDWHSLTWNLNSGIRRSQIELDSVLISSRRVSYPLEARFDFSLGHPKYPYSGRIKIRLHEEEQKWLLDGEVQNKMDLGRFWLSGTLGGYFWQPGNEWSSVREYVEPLQGYAEFFPNASPQEGTRGTIALGVGGSSIKLNMGAEAAYEWRINQFQPDSILRFRGQYLRTGRMGRGRGRLFNARVFSRLDWSERQDWKVSLDAFYRYIREPKGMPLEYLASPYKITGGGEYLFPSKLCVKSLIHFLGPKEIRHWLPQDQVLRVDAHWEFAFSLEQFFYQDRLSIHYTALHAFGKDIVEFPGEGPYRFRILVGSRFTF